MNPSATATKPADLPRVLGLLDATCIVIGTIIGVGVFIVPASIARHLPSPGMILATWTATGIVSFFGALGYAELGAMMPDPGGQYVYLREAYGPLTAFLSGWVAFLIVQSGSIAAVSVGCGIYLSYLAPQVPAIATWSPAAVIALFTWINYRGVRQGAHTQNVLTLLKVGGLLILITSAFLMRAPAAVQTHQAGSAFSIHSLVPALLGCFVAYDGWQYVAFAAGEIRNPRRNVPLALALGTAFCILIYVLANAAYLRALPLEAIAASERVAASVAARTMGASGALLITLTIVLSSAGAANGAILTTPRIYFAQARDGLFFRKMGEVHPRFGTPAFAILAQGIWSAVLALSGSYETLFSYALFAMWLFHGMTVLGVIVLRRRFPDRPRPYRMWGYPIAPLLFAAFAFWLVAGTLVARPASSVVGALVIAAGIPIYYRRRASAARFS